MYLVSGILLNSLSSVLTFNNFDFDLIFGKVDKRDIDRYHRTTFWKQVIYNIIIVVVHFV